MVRRETHRQRHVRLRAALDELVTDYLRHHPDQQLHAFDVRRLVAWAGAQAQSPTEPHPRDAGVHHNGAQFQVEKWKRLEPRTCRHCCVVERQDHRLQCTLCGRALNAHRDRAGMTRITNTG